jgi:tagatose-1,6-bisphosphate aldolase non-catalytic subunit AgaZ/GatZ
MNCSCGRVGRHQLAASAAQALAASGACAADAGQLRDRLLAERQLGALAALAAAAGEVDEALRLWQVLSQFARLPGAGRSTFSPTHLNAGHRCATGWPIA